MKIPWNGKGKSSVKNRSLTSVHLNHGPFERPARVSSDNRLLRSEWLDIEVGSTRKIASVRAINHRLYYRTLQTGSDSNFYATISCTPVNIMPETTQLLPFTRCAFSMDPRFSEIPRRHCRNSAWQVSMKIVTFTAFPRRVNKAHGIRDAVRTGTWRLELVKRFLESGNIHRLSITLDGGTERHLDRGTY